MNLVLVSTIAVVTLWAFVETRKMLRKRGTPMFLTVCVAVVIWSSLVTVLIVLAKHAPPTI